jgi:putative Se/S carrier protein
MAEMRWFFRWRIPATTQDNGMDSYGVVLFYTTSSAMRAEKVLGNGKLSIKLIPTPRELSSDCGIAIRFNWDRAGDVEALLSAARVEIEGIHQIQS